MRQLSGLDAGFLALETPSTPMSIGSVSILDPRTAGGVLDVARCRELLADRLSAAPVLCRRLASVPLDLSRPYWVDLAADQVDLERHVEATQLPAPGGWHELSELVAWEMSRRLDRDRPLWQLLFVEGLHSVGGIPRGSVAIIARVHHASIDGVSGAEILDALTDVAESLAATPSDSQSPPLEGEPSSLAMLAQAGRDLTALPQTFSRTVGQSLTGLAGGVRRRAESRVSWPHGDEARRPEAPLPFTAPRTSLNRKISAQRSWAPAFLDLARIKAIKTRESATVNDVILAVCAGALRGWLENARDLPSEPLVAMVPISVRGAGDSQSAGNLVSAMLVSLATDEPVAVMRLQRIRDAARSSKIAHQAVGARTLVDSAQLVPFALSGLGVRLYSRLQLADKHPPMFNVVITNVPGPPRELSVAGARMLAHVPAAPLFDGLGLILPVFSYAGTVAIGVTADRAIMPDSANFASLLEGALDELE